jgi:hypothetical protein
MTCKNCGGEVSVGDAFCGDCGSPLTRSLAEVDAVQGGPISVSAGPDDAVVTLSEPTAQPSISEWLTTENQIRLAAGTVIALAIVWMLYSGDALVWAFVLTPLILGALVPLLRVAVVPSTLDPWGQWFQTRRERAHLSTGKFSRFFLQPVYAGATRIWKSSNNLSDAHVRSGARVSALLYLIAVSVGALLLVAYVFIMIVLIIIAIIITFWLLSCALSGGSSSTSGTRVVRSIRKTDFFGGEKTVHYDESGREIGESRETTDFFGNPKTEHFDEEGHKIGTSRAETGFFGDRKVVHYDEQGEKTGFSKDEVGFFGDHKVVHYDERGEKTGESRHKKSFFGDDIVEHFDEEGKKTGEIS